MSGITHPRPLGDVLDAIGDTPLIEVEGIYCKLEYMNPSGSIKARIAKYMIERAEREGLLRPGDTIVEATSGNTGNALAMVAAAKGYRMIVVTPAGLSDERLLISHAFGAEIELVGHFQVDQALARARELAAEPNVFWPAQFESDWNIAENREWLGPEILGQLPPGATPDAFVMGVGTGGTLIGVGQAFRAVNPEARLFAVEPTESATISCGEIGKHAIEGIADGFIPGIFDRHRDLVDEVLVVDSAEAVDRAAHLARRHGLFVGPSSGAHHLIADNLRESEPELRTIVTVLADEGEKYTSTLPRVTFGD